MYFLTVKDREPKTERPNIALQFLKKHKWTHCTEPRLLQKEPSTVGWGQRECIDWDYGGAFGKRLFSVFSIQAKSSKTSSSLLRAAS